MVVKAGQCFILPEHAPPGWQWSGDQPVLIDGVELESGVPTRFFQTIDAYPAEWGRLTWRVQLNKIESDQAVAPVFRTFYPGVEWNLRRPDHRWFLTAWLKWEGPGPRYRDPGLTVPAQVDEDTVLFRIAWMPKQRRLDFPDSGLEADFEQPVFLRSRIDARDRRRIAETLLAQQRQPAKSDAAVIMLDDIIAPSE